MTTQLSGGGSCRAVRRCHDGPLARHAHFAAAGGDYTINAELPPDDGSRDPAAAAHEEAR